MSNIIQFKPRNAADGPDTVLENAKGQYQDVFVFGYDHDGGIDIRSSFDITCQEALWIVAMFQKKLLDGDYFPPGEF